MDRAAPERVRQQAATTAVDVRTLIFAVLPAPLLGALAAAVAGYHLKQSLSLIAFFGVAPVMTLAFARRRGVGWSGSVAFAFLALAVTACWIALLVVYMVWEIGNDWVPID